MKQLWNIISLFNDVHINQALKKTHTTYFKPIVYL